MYVAWRLGRTAAEPEPAYALVPPLLAGAVFLLARNSFHLIATYPALSDPLALLMLMGAVALVVTPVLPTTRLLLVPLCFLAPLSREELAPVLGLGLVLAAAMRLVPSALAVAGVAASAAGAAFAFHQPSSGSAGLCPTRHSTYVPCPESVTSTLRFWLDWDFGNWNGMLRFTAMVALAFGPFVLFLGPLRRALANDRPALWIAVVAAIFTAVVIFGGGDTDRILTPAGLLVALAVMLAARGSGAALLGLGVAVAAYAVQQEPLHAVDGDPIQWLTFFGLRVTGVSSVVRYAVVPSLVAVPIGIAGLLVVRFRQRLGERPAT
jgi:hypothetical protein